MPRSRDYTQVMIHKDIITAYKQLAEIHRMSYTGLVSSVLSQAWYAMAPKDIVKGMARFREKNNQVDILEINTDFGPKLNISVVERYREDD